LNVAMPERILDACCIINLFASGRAAEILSASEGVCYVSDQVRSEALSIRRPDPHDPENLLVEPINLNEACDAGWLQSCSLTGENELDAYVAFAQQLDDGEASCLAIAQLRKWTVATDDRKAIRLCNERQIKIITTPALVKRWAEVGGVDRSKVTEALSNIERFASFRPGHKSELYEWWLSYAE